MKTINVYEYEELSKEAQEKAREWWNNGNDYPFLSEYIDETLIDLLETNKIKCNNQKVYYSLSYCQGDGVMFEGSGTWKRGIEWSIKQIGLYYNAYSKVIDMPEASEKEYKEFDDMYIRICKQLEKAAYAYIEAEKEEETVAENIRANEYTFTEDGKRFG